jgi:hypothetical protein
MLKRGSWLLILFITMSGCTSVDNNNVSRITISLNADLFTSVDPITSAQELYILTKKQQQNFFDFYHQQVNKGYLPHRAIQRFL